MRDEIIFNVGDELVYRGGCQVVRLTEDKIYLVIQGKEGPVVVDDRNRWVRVNYAPIAKCFEIVDIKAKHKFLMEAFGYSEQELNEFLKV